MSHQGTRPGGSVVLTHASYYSASTHAWTPRAALTGEQQVDVCVVGGGIAGCSTALHLAERGYRVALLEAQRIGHGASGRSGGQVIAGYACGQSTLAKLVGLPMARELWAISLEGVALLRRLVDVHDIDCGLRAGHLEVAIKPRQQAELRAQQRDLEDHYGYSSLVFLERPALRRELATERYRAGLYDANGAHLHPLNYTLGLASAAERAGAILHENSAVLAIDDGEWVSVRTAQAQVRARFVVMCCNALVGDLEPRLDRRIMPVTTYLAATEPLGAPLASQLISHDIAVSDTNFILDYFRRSQDHRLLFGGRVSYSGRDWRDPAAALRRRMLHVFPQLAPARLEYAWKGKIDITVNRAPDFGRLGTRIYYLQGFSGHGIALAGIAGKLAAEAVAGHAERFDLFSKIKHRHFPGGALLRTPALVLGMLWYRLRDAL